MLINNQDGVEIADEIPEQLEDHHGSWSRDLGYNQTELLLPGNWRLTRPERRRATEWTLNRSGREHGLVSVESPPDRRGPASSLQVQRPPPCPTFRHTTAEFGWLIHASPHIRSKALSPPRD